MNKDKILELLSNLECEQSIKDKVALQISKEYQTSLDNIQQSTEKKRIDEHFGNSNHVENIATWGSANLPENVYKAMESSYEGMKIMEQLMQSSNSDIVNTESTSAYYDTNETDLIDMVYQDNYWNGQNDLVETVSDGFKSIYKT